MFSIGLMSGTSCDGVDAALIETDGTSIHKFIAEYHLPYPSEFQKKLLNLTKTHDNWFDIENELTNYHAVAVKNLLRKFDNSCNNKYVIGFHGQTIYHAPNQGICWQIGNPHMLAYLTKIDVVSDFRRRDIAYGGQGAPLVPIFHQALVKDCTYPVAIINIGGVSNITYIDENEILLGYDLGPGNALINDAMRLHFDKAYDEDGKVASSGKIDNEVLERLLNDEYFASMPPKSLDRNHFSYVLDEIKELKKEDAIATLTMFTAKAISKGLPNNLLQNFKDRTLRTIYLCGGGVKNKTISKFLQDELPDVNICSIEVLNFTADFIEAQAFAFLAARHILNLPSTFPLTTGAANPVVAGVLFKS